MFKYIHTKLECECNNRDIDANECYKIFNITGYCTSGRDIFTSQSHSESAAQECNNCDIDANECYEIFNITGYCTNGRDIFTSRRQAKVQSKSAIFVILMLTSVLKYLSSIYVLNLKVSFLPVKTSSFHHAKVWR